MANALKRYMKAKAYEHRYAILIQIHADIAPKLAEARKASDLLDRIGSCASGQSNRKEQGFVFDLGKYSSGESYGMGKQTEPDLAVENEPRYAMIQESAKLAEERTHSEQDI